MRCRTLIGALLGVAVGLAVPLATQAEHGDRGRGYGHAARVQVHGAYCGAAHRARPGRGYRGHQSARYSCRPCGHDFASHGLLRRHVHRHHHVPLWKLPFLLVARVAGHVVFYG